MGSRRTFLKMGLGASSALATSTLGLRHSRARNAAGGTCKLVIVVAYGGWDATWALDPKPDSPEVDQTPGDVQLFGDLPIWTDASRPSVTEFFAQWSDRCAVINGIAVDSLAHETCAKVMLTGRTGSEPDLGARVAGDLASDLALPYLALSPHAKTYGSESLAGELGYSNQLMMLAAPELGWPAPGQAQPDRGLDLSAQERDLVREHLERAAARELDAQHLSPRGHRVLGDYVGSLRRAELIEESARAGGVLSDPILAQQFDDPWRHIARAFAEDLSQVALAQPDLFWDTHGSNAQQGPTHEAFFAGLNSLMTALSDEGVVDDTVVLVISEMGRTPRHNAGGGKDHWPWTSAMLVGPNVVGGRAYGLTDGWLQPNPVSLATGDPDDAGQLLHAEHVLHATATLVGAAADDWFSREALHAVVG